MRVSVDVSHVTFSHAGDKCESRQYSLTVPQDLLVKHAFVQEKLSP